MNSKEDPKGEVSPQTQPQSWYLLRRPLIVLLLILGAAAMRMDQFGVPLLVLIGPALVLVPVILHFTRRAAAATASAGTSDAAAARRREPSYRRLRPSPFFRRLQYVTAGAGCFGLAATIADRGSHWSPMLAFGSVFVVAALGWRGYADAGIELLHPVRVGGPVRIRYSYARHLGSAPLDRLSCTLRCIAETPRLGGLLRPEMRLAFEQRLEMRDTLPRGAFAVDLEFDVPSDAPPTSVSGSRLVHWMLAVEGEGSGFRYDDAFLVFLDEPVATVSP